MKRAAITVAIVFLIAWSDAVAQLPEWLMHEAYAASEMANADAPAVECFQTNHRGAAVVCVTMAQWCRIHDAAGEHIACAVAPDFPRYGQN